MELVAENGHLIQKEIGQASVLDGCRLSYAGFDSREERLVSVCQGRLWMSCTGRETIKQKWKEEPRKF